jgi:hypothetical protein
MKLNKFLASAIIASTMLVTVSESFAGSIGRSSSSSSSSSRSSSSSSSSKSTSSYSAPSQPSVAPAPSKPGGIGSNTASVGVRKSEVTNGVRQDVATSKGTSPGSTGSTSAGSVSPSYAPQPSYSTAPVPQPSIGGGGLGTSFLGAVGGTIVGNALFNSFGGHSNHGSGTTVINNGTPGSSGGVVSSGPGTVAGDNQFNPGGITTVTKKEYTVWSFIADIIGFVFVVAILLGVAWLFYKGFQLVRNFINKERGVSNIPFNPTQQFWRIQRAFAEADVTELKVLLGPDVVDELTNGLTASTLTLHNVSHEVRLANATEFSIWYRFEDDGAEVNQVWHYEKFGKDWKLNGIENV